MLAQYSSWGDGGRRKGSSTPPCTLPNARYRCVKIRCYSKWDAGSIPEVPYRREGTIPGMSTMQAPIPAQFPRFSTARLLVALVLSSTALCAQSTWTGVVGTGWSSAANWNPVGVPTATTDVVIASTANQPGSFLIGPECRDLTIDSGAMLSLGGGFDLSISGDLQVNGTLSVTSGSSRIDLAGNWVNNGTFNNGGSEVSLSGTGSLGGSSTTTFENLTVSGGTRTATAGFAVNSDVSVNSSTTLNLGSFTHTVAGNWVSSAAGATVTGTGEIEFTGTGQLTSLSNTLPNIRVSAGTRTVNTSSVAGDLFLTGGTLQLNDGSTLSVGGSGSLTGGTLGWTSTFAGTELLDIEGDVTCTASAGSTSADARFEVGGNWSSTSAFSPAAGTISLDGVGSTSIGGISPSFANLELAGGTKTFNSASTCSGDLDLLSGVSLVTNAALDIDGDVTLGDGSASWSIGSATHTVAGSWTSSGAAATGLGSVSFDGSGGVSTGGGSISNVANSAGVRLYNDCTFGNLSMSGGQLRIQDAATVSVTSDVTFTGGLLAFDAGAAGDMETLDIGGNLTSTVTTVGTTTVDSVVECSGNWSSDAAFAMGSGFVSLDGVATTISGVGTVFPNLQIQGGTQTLTSTATVTLDLSVTSGSSFDCDAVVSVSGDVVLGDATASWDLGALTHSVSGDYSSSGADASGVGGIDFDSSGDVWSGSGSLSNISVSAGTRTVQDTTVLGDLDVTSATLDIQDNQTLSVGGNASFSLGTLAMSDALAGQEILDIEGNVSLINSAANLSGNSLIRVAGDWSADGSFAPVAGLVEFDGAGTNTLGGTPLLFDMLVTSGTTNVTAALGVGGDLTVVSGAALDADAVIDIDGDVSLGDGTASWDMGSSAHTVAGDLVSAGASATGAGLLNFDGTGSLSMGGGSISAVEISAGTRSMSDVDVVGNLELSGGTMHLDDDALVTVGGNADLHTGAMSFFSTPIGSAELLDVTGDVTLTATAGTMIGASRIKCSGNWTSTGAWIPPAGVVQLDGGTAATLGGVGANFSFLNIDSGTKTAIDPISIASDLSIQNGATLDADAAFDVGANVYLGNATATWDLGNSTHFVSGNYNSLGASAIGTGFIEFDGGGTTTCGSGGIANVRVTSGLRILRTTQIGGDLEHTGGAIRIGDDAAVHVSGNATFAGVVLAWESISDGVDDVLDVDGDVILTAGDGTMSINSVMRVGGNYTGAAAFVPSFGRVIFDSGSTTTVSGPGLQFANVIIESGVKTFSTSVALSGDLTVPSGATLDADAAMDIAGDVSLGDATASWDIGSSTHTVAGNFTSAGASASGLGVVEFDGSGTTNSGTGSISNVGSSQGLRIMESTNVTGELSFTGGSLRIADDALVHVVGNATLAGLALGWVGIADGIDDVLDVDGDVILSVAAGTVSNEAVLRVGGNYTSDALFAPAQGRVILDAGTSTTVSGAGLQFADLVIESGLKTVSSAATVAGSLTVPAGATLDTDAALTVTNDVLLGDATASWDMGVSIHTVSGDWTSAGASATGAGSVDFAGTGSLSTGGGTISNVLVSAGQRDVVDSTVTGDLSMSGGQIVLGDDQTLSVGGSASLLGGTLAFQNSLPGLQLIDVEGDAALACSAGTMTGESRIECAGNWSSDAAWTPLAGIVSLDGGTSTSISGVGTVFANLEIASGTKTNTASFVVNDDLDVLSGATLDSDAAVTVVGEVGLGDGTAEWDLGVDTHAVDGGFISSGASATGTGTVLLQNGNNDLSMNGGSIANLTLASGDRSVSDTIVAGNFNMMGGSMTLLDDMTLTVGGDLLFSGGTVNWSASLLGGNELIDVAGDAVVTSTAGTTTVNSRLNVAGNWTSNSSFSPADGVINLDGVGTTSITGAGPGFDPTFNDLVLSGGSRQIANDMSLNLSTIDISAGASLEVLDRVVTVPGTLITVNGDLSLDAGGTLALGPTVSMLVTATGGLSMIGDANDPATVTGTGGGGYLLSIAGAFAANNFVFEEMGGTGIVIDDAATIAAFPNDMRGGTFGFPSATPGSLMLDIQRVAPTEFRYVDFQDPLGVGTFNVRVLSGSNIDFTNSGGNLSGPAFELDPFSLIDWTLNLTTLSGFTGLAGADQVQIDFNTSAEVDVLSFLVERSTSPSGPFTTLVELPAVGPSAYGHLDTTVVGYTTYTYQISQRLSHGGTMSLGQSIVTPWSTTLPANMARVGPGGDHADIPSALAALAGQFSPMILIETGTYGPFIIDTGLLGTLRLMPDGSGPVTIDTSTGPVVIKNLNALESVEINDMTIGDIASPNIGVVVQNCLGIVILDELNILGGPGMAGLSASAASKLKVQRTGLSGTPGFEVTGGSTALAGGGSIDLVDVSGSSSVRLAGVTPGGSTVAPGSLLTSYPGVHAEIDIPDLVPLNTTFIVNLSGAPGGTCFVLYSLFNSWLDLSGPAWEMVGLIDFNFGDIVFSLPLSGAGTFSLPTSLPADGILVGIPIIFQTAVVHPFTGQRRWSNVVSLTGTP